MRTVAFIRRCVASGMDMDTAMLAAEAFEAELRIALEAELDVRREKERARQAKHRAKKNADNVVSRDKTLDDVTNVIERDLTGEPTRVETLTSSLRSEDTSEAKASSVNASKPAPPEKPKTKPPKSERGTRIPEDWEPTEADVTVARAEGLTDEEIHRAAVEFRNYWSARSRDATRLSWPKTWHNRAIEIGDRKRRNSARLAASASQPGGGRRGSGSFADIYARRHGIAAE